MEPPFPPDWTETPFLIGRESELRGFSEILDESTEFPLPAVVVVSGERGMGKTSLLRGFEARARHAGWKSAFIDLQGSLAAAATGNDVFEAELRRKLGFEKDEAFVESVSATDERAPDAATPTPPSPAVLTALFSRAVEPAGSEMSEAKVRQSLGLEKGEAFVESVPTTEERPDGATPASPSPAVLAAPLPTFARELSGRSRRSPVLILIDQFTTDHPWARWLSERFLPEFKQSQARAVVVLACDPESAMELRHPGHKVFDLGKLTEQSLRQRLTEIGQELSPPLTTIELEGYGRDPNIKPETVGSLLRVLELARRTPGTVLEAE
jgi:hypothetical protein